MEGTEEQLTEAETDEHIASEAAVTSENWPTSPEVQSEAEAEDEAEDEDEAEAEAEVEVEIEAEPEDPIELESELKEEAEGRGEELIMCTEGEFISREVRKSINNGAVAVQAAMEYYAPKHEMAPEEEEEENVA